jgi:hypothetical protein
MEFDELLKKHIGEFGCGQVTTSGLSGNLLAIDTVLSHSHAVTGTTRDVCVLEALRPTCHLPRAAACSSWCCWLQALAGPP